MGKAVRKRCVECKRSWKGDADRPQWCECGGELRAIPYTRRRPVRARRG